MRLTPMSEPYSPFGSMVASTLSRAVRNTALDEWAVLLRESLQNSVDARLSLSKPVHYYVGLDDATRVQKEALRNSVFTEIPDHLPRLTEVLARDSLPLLVIADWETSGLCGPTRADLEVDERTDFRDFFLNVGREEAKTYQGGTFGLGRGVLFEISEAGSIVVFTRTRSEGRPLARIMAMGIGNSFSQERKKFTGRHWWCIEPQGTWPEPLTGGAAERLAARLGLDLIPEDTTGTAIMIVAPRIPESHTGDDRATLEEALDAMIDGARLYGWPLMIGRHNRPEVLFEFAHAGKSWKPIPPDALDSPVRGFVEAYKLLQARSSENGPTSWHQNDIMFGGGRALAIPLGRLAFRHFPPTNDVSQASEERSIPKASIALMREPRTVVKYMRVPEHPMGSTTVGVFIADSAFDQQFAESEPVAHDDWIPAKIASTKYERNPVKQALDKIRQAVKASVGVHSFRATSGNAEGIAPVIGDLLGGMVSDTQGFGGRAGRPPARPGGGAGLGGFGGGGLGRRGGGLVKASRATVLQPQLRGGSMGHVQVAFPIRLTRRSPDSSVILQAETRVVLDTGLESEDDRPVGASLPIVVGWESLQGQVLSDRSKLRLGPGTDEVLLLVDQPRDVAVTVAINVKEAALD